MTLTPQLQKIAQHIEGAITEKIGDKTVKDFQSMEDVGEQVSTRIWLQFLNGLTGYQEAGNAYLKSQQLAAIWNIHKKIEEGGDWEYEDTLEEPELVYIFKNSLNYTCEENRTQGTYTISDPWGRLLLTGTL